MCVFLTLSHPSTRRHPAHPVSVRILCRREILADWSQKLRHRAQRECIAMFRNAVLCSKLGVKYTKNQIMIPDCCGKFTGHFDTPLIRTWAKSILLRTIRKLVLRWLVDFVSTAVVIPKKAWQQPSTWGQLRVIHIGELLFQFFDIFCAIFQSSTFSCFIFPNIGTLTNLIFLVLENFTNSNRTPPYIGTHLQLFPNCGNYGKKSSPIRMNLTEGLFLIFGSPTKKTEDTTNPGIHSKQLPRM